MVCCPHGLNAKTSDIIAVVSCANVKDEVLRRSLGWASNCSSGYLEYLVAEVSDPKDLTQLFGAATQRFPEGSTYSKG